MRKAEQKLLKARQTAQLHIEAYQLSHPQDTMSRNENCPSSTEQTGIQVPCRDAIPTPHRDAVLANFGLLGWWERTMVLDMDGLQWGKSSSEVDGYITLSAVKEARHTEQGTTTFEVIETSGKRHQFQGKTRQSQNDWVSVINHRAAWTSEHNDVDMASVIGFPTEATDQECPSSQSHLQVGQQVLLLYNDELFELVRKMLGVPEGFMEDQFDFQKLELMNFGGKGGQGLVISADRQWVLKRLSSTDHEALLQLTPAYIRRLCDHPSLLSPFLLHFSCSCAGKQRRWIVMPNALPAPKYKVKYDLKGARDDDRTVEYNGEPIARLSTAQFTTRWVGASTSFDFGGGERVVEVQQRYKQLKQRARTIKFPMTHEQYEYIQECIAADSKLLLQHQIMDYSLLVGIIEGKAPAVGIGSKTFVVQHTKGYTTYHIAIIDFLQAIFFYLCHDLISMLLSKF